MKVAFGFSSLNYRIMQNISKNLLLSKLGLGPKNNLYTVQPNLEHVVPFERTALK